MFEIDDADDLPLVDQRHGQFGASLRVFGDITAVAADVRRQHGLAQLGGGADQAFAQRHRSLAGDALAITGGKAVFKLLGALAPQQDGEHLEVDDALQQLANAL